MDAYFGNLEKFLNISKFGFNLISFVGRNNVPSKHCTTIMKKMIENNKKSLTSLIITGCTEDKRQALGSVFLPRLELLRLRWITVEGFFLKGLYRSDGSDEPFK